MAYETGSATDHTDLMSKLNTFAAANGFTTEYHNGTNRHLSLSRSANNIYVSFHWDNVNTIAMYQALGYSGGSAETPWLQANDSGNGSSDLPTNIDRGRQVSRTGAGPFTAYHFFAHTSPYVIYIVLEFSPGLYRHFGFGYINKTGTWTGGAWCAGHLWHWGGSSPFNVYDTPDSTAHTVLMDNLLYQEQTYYGTNNNDAGGTLHVEGLFLQDSASKWGHAVSRLLSDSEVRLDRAGNPRVRIGGGCRGGPALAQFGRFLPDLANGFIPIIPMELFYYDGRGTGDHGWYLLGVMPHVGHIHLHGIDAAQALTVGSDTWMAFPMVRKSNIGGDNQESRNAGIIYKKVT